jgi:hypothetical protein
MIKFYLDPEDDDELNISPEEWEDIENDILDIMYDREDPDFDNDQISDDADNYCD